jgi:Transposase DDE domain
LLVEHGLQLITKLRKNMHNQLLAFTDALLLRKRALIETIHDQPKKPALGRDLFVLPPA